MHTHPRKSPKRETHTKRKPTKKIGKLFVDRYLPVYDLLRKYYTIMEPSLSPADKKK